MAGGAAVRRSIERLHVIDTDAHITEPPDLWSYRAPAPSRDRRPQLFETNFPHPTCLHPSVREHIVEVTAEWTESRHRKTSRTTPPRSIASSCPSRSDPPAPPGADREDER